MGTAVRRQFYPHLESLRGVAALCVVLFHVFGDRSPQPQLFSHPELFAHPTFDPIANLVLTSLFGGTGAVTLFFVLSGFVLAESLADRETISVRVYGAFLVRRVFRLLPVAWASLGLAVLLMIYFHHMVPPWHELPGALLFQLSAIEPFNGPLWSINVESIASAIFPLLLLASRRLGPGRFLLLVALLWAEDKTPYIAIKYLFCFQLGIMAKQLMIPLLRCLNATWSGVLLWAAVALVLLPTNASRLGFISEISHIRLESIGSVYIIGYVIFDHGSRLVRFLDLAPMRFLGRISYSLYAYHYPIIGSLAFVAWSFIPAENYLPAQTLCATLVLPATIAVSAISHWLFERPLHDLGRRLASRVSPTAIAEASTGAADGRLPAIVAPTSAEEIVLSPAK